MEDDLNCTIENLLKLGHEGTYWDFKSDYTDCAEDKLIDIICMANNIDGRDAYLIYGANDDGSVEGIENTTYSRYTSKSLTEFLRCKPFAGDYIPHVTVNIVNIGNHELDVVTVHKSRFVPYYLREDFGTNPQYKKRLRAGNIYVRVNDVNTPRDKTARFEHVELLWRRRFGIDITPYEKMMSMLKFPRDWTETQWDINRRSYNKYNPEYQVVADESSDGYETLRYFYDDERMLYAPLKLTYLSTILYETELWYMDLGRCLIPKPETRLILEKHFYYYYFEKDTINGSLLPHFAYGKSICNNRSGLQMPVLIFEDKDERLKFEEWVDANIDLKSGFASNIENNAVFQHIHAKEQRDGNPEYGILDVAVSFAFYKKWLEEEA